EQDRAPRCPGPRLRRTSSGAHRGLVLALVGSGTVRGRANFRTAPHARQLYMPLSQSACAFSVASAGVIDQVAAATVYVPTWLAKLGRLFRSLCGLETSRTSVS